MVIHTVPIGTPIFLKVGNSALEEVALSPGVNLIQIYVGEEKVMTDKEAEEITKRSA